jgi:teichuronic acid biosynthesis glycosyltransferase TuaG
VCCQGNVARDCVSRAAGDSRPLPARDPALDSDMTVSAVIPAYNAESTIAETLDSILAQTIPVHEIIVVDDVSPDDTVGAVRRWHDSHPQAPLVIIEQSENTGPAGARNSGIERASGEWIAFLDSDDAWLPEKTAIQLQAVAENPNVDLVCGRTVPLEDVDSGQWTVESGSQRSEIGSQRSAVGGLRSDVCGPSFAPSFAGSYGGQGMATEGKLQSTVCSLTLEDFVHHNPVATSTVMARRDVLLGVGGFDGQFCGPEDYDLWLRVVADHKCLELDVPLTRYRSTVGSLSMDERKFLPQVLRVLEKAFGPGGALEKHQGWRRRSYAEQYSSASWMAYNRGANGTALRYLLMSWVYDVRRLYKEQQDPLLRLKILFRYVFRRKPDVEVSKAEIGKAES